MAPLVKFMDLDDTFGQTKDPQISLHKFKDPDNTVG